MIGKKCRAQNANGDTRWIVLNASGIETVIIMCIKPKKHRQVIATNAYYEGAFKGKEYFAYDAELCFHCEKNCKGDCAEARAKRKEGRKNEISSKPKL